MRPYFTPEEQAEARDDQARLERKASAMEDLELRLKIADHFAGGRELPSEKTLEWMRDALAAIVGLQERVQLLEDRMAKTDVVLSRVTPITAKALEERELERMKGRAVANTEDGVPVPFAPKRWCRNLGRPWSPLFQPTTYNVPMTLYRYDAPEEDSQQPERSERP